MKLIVTRDELRDLLNDPAVEAEWRQLRAENSRLLQRLQEEKPLNVLNDPRVTKELTAAIAARDHNAQQLDAALDTIDKHNETIDKLRAQLRKKARR
jgi:benzoyl-CoA reductase/2-hydroxyglutaryl-CoA dehydratase subunit BcrC/BadD/HgdB